MVSLFEHFFQDWRAEKHGSEGKRAELRRKTELLQERVVSTAEHEHVDTCLHSGVRGKQNITHEQDHHAQEHHGHLYLRRPPQVRTTSDSNCFHRLDRFVRKKLIHLGRKLQSFGFSDQFFLARKKNPRLLLLSRVPGGTRLPLWN